MMKEKINVAELLKDCPIGMELDCTICDNVFFDEVTPHMIRCYIKNDAATNSIYFHHDGSYLTCDNAKCVIFPKGRTTWDGFHRPFKDGEVVAYDGQYRGHVKIFIFKDKKEYNTLSTCYLMLDGDELDLEEGVHYVTRIATEEEKQKLFDAIKANGYKWNEESKTLEKLIEPKFKVGDTITNGDVTSIIKQITKDSYILDIKDGDICFNYVFFKDQDKWKLIPNKFDINTLVPFDKVLVRDNNTQKWTADFFSFFDKSHPSPYICVGHYTDQCIPYEGNEHLRGTTNDCDEYYKNW